MALEDQKTLDKNHIVDLSKTVRVFKKRFVIVLTLAAISGFLTYYIKASEPPHIEVKIKLLPNKTIQKEKPHYNTVIHDFFNFQDKYRNDTNAKNITQFKKDNHISKVQLLSQSLDTNLVHFKITYYNKENIEKSVDEFLNICNEYLLKIYSKGTHSTATPFYSLSNPIDPFYIHKIKQNNPLKAGLVIFIIITLMSTLFFVFIEDIRKPSENS